MDHVQLVPVLLGDQSHQLAAGEVADTDDEVGTLDLGAQVEARYLVELVRAVDGEAPGPGRSRAGLVTRDQQRDVGHLVRELGVQMADSTGLAPPPDDHRLGEVEELPDTAAKPGPAEAERQSKGREVGRGRASECREMRPCQLPPAGRQNRVGAGVLPSRGLGQQLVIGRAVNRDGVDLHTASAQTLHLAQDERVRYGRVVADEVGDLHGSSGAGARLGVLHPCARRASGRRGSYR